MSRFFLGKMMDFTLPRSIVHRRIPHESAKRLRPGTVSGKCDWAWIFAMSIPKFSRNLIMLVKKCHKAAISIYLCIYIYIHILMVSIPPIKMLKLEMVDIVWLELSMVNIHLWSHPTDPSISCWPRLCHWSSDCCPLGVVWGRPLWSSCWIYGLFGLFTKHRSWSDLGQLASGNDWIDAIQGADQKPTLGF